MRLPKKLTPRPTPPSYEELELWPDAIWRLAALLKAGSTPASACQAVLTQLSQHLDSSQQELSSARSFLPWGLTQAQRRAENQALEELVDIFEQCAAQAAEGRPLASVCQKLAQRQDFRESTTRGLLALGACWQVTQTTGAPVATVFERLARYLETEIDLSQQRETALSGPRTTGRILSWLPLLGLGLGALMGTDPLGVLLGSWAGAFTGLLGLLLALSGHRWTHHLISAAEKGELT